MKKKAILVASFGTSIESAYKTGILPVVEAVTRHFSDCDVVQAYTSRMIIKTLEEKGIQMDTPYEAVCRLCSQSYEEIYVLPSHIIPGIEYEKVCRDILEAKKLYPDAQIRVGKALLQVDGDFTDIIKAFREELDALEPGKALVVMGHGTEHFAHAVYFRFLYEMNKISPRVFFTAVEGVPGFEDICAELRNKGIQDAILKPLMITAGDHVLNDMASDSEDSLKSVLSAAGIRCECRITGLGSLPAVQDMLIRHLESLQ